DESGWDAPPRSTGATSKSIRRLAQPARTHVLPRLRAGRRERDAALPCAEPSWRLQRLHRRPATLVAPEILRRDEKYADASSTRESRWTADHTPCRNAAAGARRSLLLAPADAVDAADPAVVPHLHRRRRVFHALLSARPGCHRRGAAWIRQ